VPELDLETIAAAGLAVADACGPKDFTMRAVADRLGVTPMALYHHVADKRALVELVVDGVIRERPLPAPTGEWREDLWQMARWMREMTRAHPTVSHLRRLHQVWTPSVLPMTEQWFSLWRQSGLNFDDAILAGTVGSMAIIGLVEEEQLFLEMDLPTPDALATTPNARTAFQRNPDREAEFELVVRSLIDGLLLRLNTDADPVGATTTPRARAGRKTG
jgi:AcrR family transcriptional regulator